MKINLLPDIYYVCSSDQTVLLAYDLREKDGYILFFDSAKERFMKYSKIIENTEEKFVFLRDSSELNATYTFRPFKFDDYLNNKKFFILEKRVNNLEEFKSLFIR